MGLKDKGFKLEDVEVRMGIGVFICLLLTKFFPVIQGLAACTAVIMCTQDNRKASGTSGIVRLEGVVIGGIFGVIVVLLDNLIQMDYIFYCLEGLGVLCTVLCCKLVKMSFIAGRVACITFVLDTVLLQGNMRIQYALLRFLGTLVGALVTLSVSSIWEDVKGKRRYKMKAFEEDNGNG